MRSTEQTPAQRAGFEIGSRAVVASTDNPFVEFVIGETIELAEDDNSDILYWRSVDDPRKMGYLRLASVRKANNPTATILREIADVIDADGDPVEEFEHKSPNGGWAQPSDTRSLIMSSFDYGWQVRRKPRAVRVSGEVSREDIECARTVIKTGYGSNAEHATARALLSLVEDDHD